MAASSGNSSSLHQRLLQDISELQTKPYPNIDLHIRENDFHNACLVLTVEYYGPLHLTVHFTTDYPLSPPTIRMDSDIRHPNIFGTYICASILNTVEGYTPAYTLRGIAIQLLSFFSSDSIEQSGGGYNIDLSTYREGHKQNSRPYLCQSCDFGRPTFKLADVSSAASEASTSHGLAPRILPTDIGSRAGNKTIEKSLTAVGPASFDTQNCKLPETVPPAKGIIDAKLPDEILLLFCEKLETDDLLAFAKAWERVGYVMMTFDVIRTKELQCFCLKKDYTSSKLGVGVSVGGRRTMGFFESEFDLLSEEGFKTHGIRRSVQGVPFQHWLPLPISQGHWRKIRQDAHESLSSLSTGVDRGSDAQVETIYHFMNDVVVKLNHQASTAASRAQYYHDGEVPKSSLTHASEKAIESYFHLFHLLLCLATEQPGIVRLSNERLDKFVRGGTSKTDCPNLGHLLVAMLISDVEMTPEIMKTIIKETITRNVVWMLDKRGANMPELSYIEPNEGSNYRLQQTFQASKTSYRLLMFLNLFRKTAVGHPRKPLTQLRDEAFIRHGAPPMGSAKGLADSIKRIHEVESFPAFFRAMDLETPQEAQFTAFLKSTIVESVKKGYSSMPITQGQALSLRQIKDPGIGIAVPGIIPARVNIEWMTFFPAKNRGRNNRRT
ncbi:uncharacterized protein BP5553_03129 [Venustampulla echinocandica]|uniref:UBC core domain-containing protein n=1 Tax=Venustampulla echinocandica TaxID=2656787 RepID=A0A370TTC8_9HELO|nr:uncharacterized protein BP5553_03129 [Venustampulla echinocandica]RDL38789.1 hypothetical protein BP5553_03129 [Venustampulla echinocandica]